MADSDLSIATTTDSLEVAEALAQDIELRNPAPPEFKDESGVVSYEHPRSERVMLLERLAEQAELEASDDLRDMTGTVITNDPGAADPNVATELTAGELAQVRQAAMTPRQQAVQAGIAEGQRQQEALVQEYNQALEVNRGRFAEVTRGRDPKDIQDKLNNLQVQRTAAHALYTLPGGADATLYLIDHPEEQAKLRDADPEMAQARASWLAARFAPEDSAPRPRQQTTKPHTPVPAPISPVGGSATKSSIPLDQMSYQDYRRQRDLQQKNRFKR